MPLGRYFFFAGSMLLALLFLADWYMPQLAATQARAELDRTVIRLHSLRKWPERIVIDTNLPTIVPPPADVVAEAPPVKPAPAARSPSDAFALVTPVETAAPAAASKHAPKRRTRAARTSGHVASSEAIGFRAVIPAGW